MGFSVGGSEQGSTHQGKEEMSPVGRDLNRQVKHTVMVTNQCKYCEEQFSKKSYLVQHQKIHFGDKTFQCTYCGFSFAKKRNLVRHNKIHSMDNSFQCDHCRKGEKPFKC